MICRIVVLGGAMALIATGSFAQASPADVTYCNALSSSYRTNVGSSRPDADVTQAMGNCNSQPQAAIPVLEKALTNNKVKLPARN